VVTGFTHHESRTCAPEAHPGTARTRTPLIAGAGLYELPRVTDDRGHLSFAEFGDSLPFAVMRYFLVFGVPSREIRGEHAHRGLDQFLVCVHGSCSVRLFDGDAGEEILLNRPDLGLHVPPMVWTTEYKYSPDAVLLVLASDIYREDDYIRNVDEYLALQEKMKGDICDPVP
jgi:dTDP-4-dehydrorhamnose 3,5-epimerase-like enzyme